MKLKVLIVLTIVFALVNQSDCSKKLLYGFALATILNAATSHSPSMLLPLPSAANGYVPMRSLL